MVLDGVDLLSVGADHVVGSRHHPGGLGPEDDVTDAALAPAVSLRDVDGVHAAVGEVGPGAMRPMDQEEARHREVVRPDRVTPVAPGLHKDGVVVRPVADTIVAEDPVGVLEEAGPDVAVPGEAVTDVGAVAGAVGPGVLQVLGPVAVAGRPPVTGHAAPT